MNSTLITSIKFCWAARITKTGYTSKPAHFGHDLDYSLLTCPYVKKHAESIDTIKIKNRSWDYDFLTHQSFWRSESRCKNPSAETWQADGRPASVAALCHHGGLQEIMKTTMKTTLFDNQTMHVSYFDYCLLVCHWIDAKQASTRQENRKRVSSAKSTQ